MKHTAQINTEFVKLARKWEDMSLEDQKGYLSNSAAFDKLNPHLKKRKPGKR